MLPERMMELPTDRVRRRSLEDFERLYAGVGPENYVWYQCGLVVAAKSIYEATGVDVLRRLYRTFATQQGTLTDQQLAQLLEARVHPMAAQTMRMWPSAPFLKGGTQTYASDAAAVSADGPKPKEWLSGLVAGWRLSSPGRSRDYPQSTVRQRPVVGKYATNPR